jgi:hypothetical protein
MRRANGRKDQVHSCEVGRRFSFFTERIRLNRHDPKCGGGVLTVLSPATRKFAFGLLTIFET